MLNQPAGCVFHPRCPYAIALCREKTPVLEAANGSRAACHRAHDLDLSGSDLDN
jgi:oligopeptide/dipeptide ABC transporter ATP-binding protein